MMKSNKACFVFFIQFEDRWPPLRIVSIYANPPVMGS